MSRRSSYPSSQYLCLLLQAGRLPDCQPEDLLPLGEGNRSHRLLRFSNINAKRIIFVFQNVCSSSSGINFFAIMNISAETTKSTGFRRIKMQGQQPQDSELETSLVQFEPHQWKLALSANQTRRHIYI